MSIATIDQQPARSLGVRQMNPVAKALIVEALRSREYTQTTDALRIGDAFCVLGVVCDVFRKATGRGEWEHDPDGGSVAFVVDGAVDCGEPPSAVVEWCGWWDDEEATWLDYNPTVAGKPLTVWNDTLPNNGKTFLELADLIEEYL